MPEFENINDLLKRGQEVVDRILELIELAKEYYENAENEGYKRMFKDLNIAYHNAANAILKKGY